MAIVTRQPRAHRWRDRQRPPGACLPGDSAADDDTTFLSVAARWSRWLALGTVLVAAGSMPWLPASTAPTTLVVAGLFFAAGVPHGAIDHLMASRLTGGRSIPLVAAAYAGLAAAAWALMTWVGPVALLLIVALSALHFGLGELEISRQLTGWRPRPILAAAIVVAGCGSLLLPLARSGEQIRTVASAVSPDVALLIGTAWMQVGLVAAWVGAAVVALTSALRSGHRTVALDIVLIGLLGALAPPLVAFAVWFGGWHALRHCARMLTVEPGCAKLVATGRRVAAVRRFAGLAAVPSIAALTVVAGLAWFTVVAPDPTTVVTEVLRLLLALTVPHMVVVLWLDRSAARRQPAFSTR